MTLVSVVVPVYYNADCLPILHQRLSNVAQAHDDCLFEFIFVDDASLDNSFAVLRELAKNDQRVRIVKLSRNFGSNVAFAAGLSYARGNCVAMIAADLQDPPEMISDMLSSWYNGKKVVLAARRQRADPLLKRLPAAVFNKSFRRFVFKDFPPNGFDFALIDRQVVDILVSCAEKNTHIYGLLMWVGFERTVLFYDRAERQYGRSMWTFTKKVKYFIDAFTAFSYLPLRVASSLGFLLAGVGLIYALVVMVLRIVSGIPVEGWSSLMVVLLLTSGTQLVILGVIGEYIWRGLEQTRARPLFVVDKVIERSQEDAKASEWVSDTPVQRVAGHLID
jgi:dolichol-phosphate mannosyltransferase